MRDGADRRPGAVPDGPVPDGGDGGPGFDGAGADVGGGADTDGDGLGDTLLTPDGLDLLVLTDLDGDGLADRVLRIGSDGAVHADGGSGPPDFGTGSAPAHTPWDALLDRLLGSDT